MSSWSDLRPLGAGTTGPPAPTRVLRGSEARRVSGAAIDGDLRAQAVRHRGIAPELVAEVTEEARRAAAAEGYADGLAAARAEAAATTAAVDRALAALEAATRDLERRRATTMADIEDAVAALAFEVATALVGRELQVAADPGRDAVARALRLDPPPGPTTVRLHPADVRALGSSTELVPGRQVTVMPDATLSPGDAVVEVGATTIDARIGPALERVRELLAP